MAGAENITAPQAPGICGTDDADEIANCEAVAEWMLHVNSDHWKS